MKIVRVAIRGWVDVSLWDGSDDNGARAKAMTALSNEVESWLQGLHSDTEYIGGNPDAFVEDWSFADDGFEAGEVRGA